MTDLRGTNRAAGPVITGVIGVVVVGAAVPLGAGENLMLNRRRIADAVNQLPMLVARGLLEQVAAALRLNEGVAVKLAQVRRDDGVLRLAELRERPVEPRSGADTITCVDGGLSGACLGTQIGMPGVTARADNSRRESAWAADVYRRARARGCDHPHAIRVLGRAWARVLWRAWTDGQPY